MLDIDSVIKGLKYLHDRETWKEGPMVFDDKPEERRKITADAIALLKAHGQFLQWLVRLVTHEDGDGAECEIICRRLRDMGYVEKYEENGVEYWRAVKRNELD